jgi:uncharacterized membrane protein (DUF4010 family)
MEFSFFSENGLEHLPKFAIALVIGLLIGTERELSPAAKAGVRTFALVTLFGTLAGLLAESSQSGWIIAVGALLVGIMMIAAYQRDNLPGESGSTTVVAILVSYCLGAMVWYGYSQIAAMLAIITTILLYFKAELHGVTHGLTRKDLVSIFQFAVLSVIILPILPDINYGPFETLNPHQTWLMVVLVSGVSLAGYLALRIVGERYGAPLLGLLGGLVSSTATTVVYSRNGRAHPEITKIAVIVILLANLVVLVRLMLVTAVVSNDVLPHLAPVLGTGLLLGLIGTFSVWRRWNTTTGTPLPEISNPTELRTALGFGALYAIVLLLAAWLSNIAGTSGLYMLALVSGLTDVDAITLSSLRLHELGSLSKPEAVTAISIALLSNIAFKLGIVFTIGGPALGWPVLRGMLLVVAGIGGALFLV